MRLGVFEGDFSVLGCQPLLYRAFQYRSGIGVRRTCFNAVVTRNRVGLIRCEPGCNVQEQSLVGISTGQQEADTPGIAQDHRTDLE
jgi:hypothetical protein